MASEGSDMAYLTQLVRTEIMDLLPEPPKPSGDTGKDFWLGIVTVSSDDNVRTAFEKLVKNNILSAPVRSGIQQRHSNTFNGFIDMLDLVDFVVTKLDVDHGQDLTTVADVQQRLQQVQETLDISTVRDLMAATSHRTSLSSFPLTEDFSLYSAVELLAYQGCHRIPVINDHKKVVNVVTQSMVIRHVHANLELLPDHVKNKAVREFVSKEVHVVEEGTRAIKACEIMSRNSINGLAVVDLNGKLVDVFSVKDLRGIGLEGHQIWRLFMPVLVYKHKQIEIFPDLVPSSVVAVKMDDTFESVLEKFVTSRVHRIFVVDEEGKPIHRISISCLLRVVLSVRN